MNFIHQISSENSKNTNKLIICTAIKKYKTLVCTENATIIPFCIVL